MSFGSRWAAILLFVACVFGFRVCAEAVAAESRIVGIFRNDDGDPISGISLTARDMGGVNPSIPFARTDDEGRFQFELANGDWRIEPNSEELNERGYFGVSTQVTLNSETRELTIVAFRPRESIFGKVTDMEGSPVTNIRVIASFFNNTFAGRTDADGNYSIPVIGGVWHVRFDEWELQQQGIIPPEILSTGVREGEDRRLDIQLMRARLMLVANVRDSAGQPVENGSLSARLEGTFISTAARIENGVAELRLVNGPWILSVLPYPEHKTPPRRRVFMIDALHEIDFTLETQVMVDIAGRVIDEDGNGVAGIDILARELGHQPGRALGFRTAGDGTFSTRVEAGDYLFTGGASALVPRTTLHAPAPGQYEHLIRMRRATGEIVVRSRLAERPNFPSPVLKGAALRDGNVYTFAAPINDETRIPVFDADWQLSMEPDYAEVPATLSIRGQTEIFEVRFTSSERSARIRGQVIDERNLAVPFAQIKAWRSTLAHEVEYGVTDANGLFELTVAPGDWQVSAYQEDQRMWLESMVFARAVQAGETREAGEIRWPWGGALVVVRLTDESGRALSPDWPYIEFGNFRARLRAEHSRGFYGAVPFGPLAPSGEFVFRVAPGRWTFEVEGSALNSAGYATSQPVEITVPASGAFVDVPVKPIGRGSETPQVKISTRLWSGETILETFAEEFRSVRIESSDNLRDWTLHTFLEWPGEMIIPRGLERRFFRAVTEY